MFDLLYLGTAASSPTIDRNLSSLVVMQNEHRFMIDCGEGTQRQLLTSGIGVKHFNHFLITHSHLDHILGFGGLISTLVRWDALEEMHFYGGADAIEKVRSLMYNIVLGKDTPVPLIFHELSAPGVIFEDTSLTVSCFPVTHAGTNSFGYRFEERGRRPFSAAKAAALNIPSGPWRKDLVNGKSVVLPDGRKIDAEMVTDPYKRGTCFVAVGDTGNAMELLPYVKGADALSIESTYTEDEAEMAASRDHLTAKMAAELAQAAGVEKLILTHLSARHSGKDVLEEAQRFFPAVEVASDYSQYQIRQVESK